MGATTSARMTTVSAPATTATAMARTIPRAEAPTFSTTPKNSSPMTRKMSPSRVSSTVCQLVREATRWAGGSIRGPRWPVMSPATTAATRPEPCMCSAGIAARKGTVKDTTVSTVGSVMWERTRRLASPTSHPTPRATRTARAKPPRTPPTLTPPEVAAETAEDRTTSAVASLSSPSPSRTVMMRWETPSRRAMEMATASVGLRIAPMAMAQARESPGTRRVRTAPITAADRGTSRMASTATGASSRRKLMVEMLTAVENSSGGEDPLQDHLGVQLDRRDEGQEAHCSAARQKDQRRGDPDTVAELRGRRDGQGAQHGDDEEVHGPRLSKAVPP